MTIENAPRARTHTHVFHSARSFDNDGLLVFNPDRYAVPSSICFAPEDPPPEPAPPQPATFTQEQVNALIAKERKASEAKFERTLAERTAETNAKLAELQQAQEDAGKSAAEKAQAQAARERAVIEAKLADTAKTLAERDALVAARTQELRDTRLDYEIGGLFAARKVMPEAQRAASLVFRADAKFEHDDSGKVIAVDLGNKRFDSVAAAMDEWMKTNGAIYVAAPAGGAGTKPGSAGTGGRKLVDMTDDELLAASARRPAVGR